MHLIRIIRKYNICKIYSEMQIIYANSICKFDILRYGVFKYGTCHIDCLNLS